MIRQTGPRTFKLYTHDGRRVLGTHPSYAAALRQERAVEASKARRENPSKPRRKILGFTGDVDAIDHGGGIVMDTGYGPEWWVWHAPEDDRDPYYVHRIPVPGDVFRNYAWTDPDAVADTSGTSIQELLRLGSSHRLEDRMEAMQDVAGHYGYGELDHSPIRFTRAEMVRRFGPTFRAKRRSASR